jgi:hypothetical protein
MCLSVQFIPPFAMATSVYGMEPTRSAIFTSLRTSITVFFITLATIYITHRVFIMNRGSNIFSKLFTYLEQTIRDFIAEFQRPEFSEPRIDYAVTSRGVIPQTEDIEYSAVREYDHHTGRQNQNTPSVTQHHWICVCLNF